MLLIHGAAGSAVHPTAIVVDSDAGALGDYAAREVRRYVYVRTGKLLPIRTELPLRGELIVLGRQGDAVVRQAAAALTGSSPLGALGSQEYWLKSMSDSGRSLVLVVGGSETSLLYGVYRLAEHLGARFYLHGDVLPDRLTRCRLPPLDERRTPLFALRGIQPFHDFPEGPDWWNLDDYLAILAQLPKLGMNFFGLHTYPENGPNAEPTVWIGVPEQITADGRVTASYPASYQNTRRGNWGYRAKNTSDFHLGAAQLFERDDYGPEVMWGHMPEPADLAAGNAVFNRTAALLRQAFQVARALGVKTCVGTETPLTVPQRLKEWLADEQLAGRTFPDAAARAAAREEWLKAELHATPNRALIGRLYAGIFQRAARAYAPDYYWFWTPETWTWEGTKDEQVRRVLDDLAAAIEVHRTLRPPFQLATCGWVLGPQQDRALFDKVLPKDVAVSCINRDVGRTPVDKGFATVQGRGKWAIPWLEDDPALTSPQLWAGRMRRDAADALRYGCDGLLGIHWRTRVLGPAVRALSQAAWDQNPWAGDWQPVAEMERADGAVGGKTAQFADHAIADTDDDPLYQSLRYDMSAYHLRLPNGRYRVTLKFCEPHYQEAGKRVFDVRLQGQPVLQKLDIFAKVGQDRALDCSFSEVAVTNGWLTIDFAVGTEYPSIAAIVAEAGGMARKINCGGEAYGEYEADAARTAITPKFPPSGDLYTDWAAHEFGPEIAAAAGQLLARLDGVLPRASDWVKGPGGIKPDGRAWIQVAPEYAFVDEWAALGPRVRGTGQRARFDYWLNTFQYARAMARLNCTWGQYTNAVGQVRGEANTNRHPALARELVLPLRRQLVRDVEQLYHHLLATVSNPGELGTVANWEQHNLPDVLEIPGDELAKLMGSPLPADAYPSGAYAGRPRLIVPTVRTALRPGEPLNLKVIVLDRQPPREVTLLWRRLGAKAFAAVPLRHVNRGVYRTELTADAMGVEDFEYYVRVETGVGNELRFPAAAPELNQTVVTALPPRTPASR